MQKCIEIVEGTIAFAGGYCINGKRFIGDEHEALVGEAKQMAYATGRKVEEVLIQIVPCGIIMQKGDVVRFKEPIDPSDKSALMVLEEDPDGGRVLVRHLVDMKLQPTNIYPVKDLILLESKNE